MIGVEYHAAHGPMAKSKKIICTRFSKFMVLPHASQLREYLVHTRFSIFL